MSKSLGWFWPSNSKQAHYFINTRSLCGTVTYLGNGTLEDYGHESPDNCAACKKKNEIRNENKPITDFRATNERENEL